MQKTSEGVCRTLSLSCSLCSPHTHPAQSQDSLLKQLLHEGPERGRDLPTVTQQPVVESGVSPGCFARDAAAHDEDGRTQAAALSASRPSKLPVAGEVRKASGEAPAPSQLGGCPPRPAQPGRHPSVPGLPGAQGHPPGWRWMDAAPSLGPSLGFSFWQHLQSPLLSPTAILSLWPLSLSTLPLPASVVPRHPLLPLARPSFLSIPLSPHSSAPKPRG